MVILSTVALRKCPVCGASVRLDKLERHLRGVHPRDASRVSLTKAEEREVRASRSTSRTTRRVGRTAAAVAVGIALLVASALAAAIYLPRSEPEQMVHWHPNLSITIDGMPQVVPANIGIDSALYRDHSLDSHSMMSMAPLHTHDTTGQIHVEWMGSTEGATLGNFFRIWGQSFDGGQLLGHPAGQGHAVWMVVNGQDMAPSPSLALQDGMTIHLACGPA